MLTYLWDIKPTRLSECAFLTLLYLAEQESAQPVPAHDIAKARSLSVLSLKKMVLKPLVFAGLLTPSNGPDGGYSLVKPVAHTTLLEVVEAVDGPIHGEAPGVRAVGGAHVDAKLQEVCDEAAALVRRILDEVKVSELVNK